MIRVNLGCWIHCLPDYLNLEVDASHKADLYADMRKGLPFKDNCVSEIRANHVLEHLTYDEGKLLLDDAYRVLQNNGKLLIEVPNLKYVCKVVADNTFHTNPLNAFTLLYGSGEMSSFQLHRAGYTPQLLKQFLQGFDRIDEEFIHHVIRVIAWKNPS